ncbi:L,D-transpeptidase [Enterovirga rhinocerotis]|uniref:Lipoprotein-anchoring transpeptidase ErfK/SrfK n=1 Tax=Enterovirga rhinocerotis TaxID=1339210 RepID=A0A4R7BW23_9HYPH|nr:L,D-transpeptidase [Enterovirga rhinocerotis]TDR89663.1 lipoprotein-anchoring transpeptidase ErfK/SrfK [Enterovirga rhinocerotis]
MRPLTRRAVVLAGLGTSAGLLGGCALLPEDLFAGWSREAAGPLQTPDYAKIYAAIPGEKHRVPAFDFTNTDPAFLRAEVAYAGTEPAGTLVVDPKNHHLYRVEGRGRARRYGIAVGPEAKGFSGQGVVATRREWPDWSPAPVLASRGFAAWAQLGSPAAASERPAGETAARAIPGGPRSPLGARSLSLASGGRETGFMIHGTPNPIAIGGPAKAGCIALIDQDIIDLYARTPEGTTVVVLM